MENRKRNIQMKFYVTEEEKRLIDEKMKQLPIKQYGAYFRKMAIDGYILVVDRSDTKAYIRELQAVSRNINQIAKRANATGTVYRQDIEDIKKAVDEIWRLQRRTLGVKMGLPIACIKFCVLYRVATMQHDRASVPVLANVDTHMRYPRRVVCTRKENQIPRLRVGNAG